MFSIAQRTLLLIVLSCVVVTSGCGASTAATDRPAAPVQPPTRARAHDGVGVVVDVSGAVRRPGVYLVAHGARVYEAITAAGGALPGADLTTLNRAQPVTDGQHIVIPVRGAMHGGGGARAVTRININQASVDELDELPGIGPVTAERIVAHRVEHGSFARIEDLDQVSGIGPAIVESLRDVAAT